VVAYSFKSRFADAVASGAKRQTIRANGKRRHARPGEALQLYTGMRTKDCRKLRDAVCVISTYCAIYDDRITTGKHPSIDLDEFAQRDGFADFTDMTDWFRETHGLPFIGQLIVWE
jgi:hypothetical protein